MRMSRISKHGGVGGRDRNERGDSPTPSHLNPGRILNRLGALGPLYLGRLGPLFFLLLYTDQLFCGCDVRNETGSRLTVRNSDAGSFQRSTSLISLFIWTSSAYLSLAIILRVA
jgi:hypothetical protein